MEGLGANGDLLTVLGGGDFGRGGGGSGGGLAGGHRVSIAVPMPKSHKSLVI